MKNNVRRTFALLLVVLLLLPLLPAKSDAATNVVYDAANYARFQRSSRQVTDRWMAAINTGSSYVDLNPATFYSRPASIVYPYDQGALSQDTVDHMYAVLNTLRWLEGAEPLKSTATNNDSMQRCALIRNFDFSHTVSDSNKPADMSQSLWNSGKVENHMLARGHTPENSILGWANEGYNATTNTWGTLGHRYNILEQDIGMVALGYSGTVTAGAITAYKNSTSLPFSAFPFPGPVPTEFVLPDVCAWGVELNSSVFTVPNNGNNLVVTVTNAATGESYSCTKANGKLKYATWQIEDINFVQPPCSGTQYAPGSVYNVVITGLNEKSTGKAAEIRYQVNFFTLYEFIPGYDITLIMNEGGEASCSAYTAVPGELITVTATPNNGYRVQTIYWTADYGSPNKITKTRSFTMPKANVTVEVVFAEAKLYDLVLEVGPHGSASLSLDKASADQEIIVYTQPDDTYAVDKITWETKNTTEPVDISSTGSFIMTSAKTTVKVSFKRYNPFVDVPDNSWFAAPVLWAYYHEPRVTSGLDKTHFGPNETCTREQVVTFLWAAFGKEEPSSMENPFTDVPDDAWYLKPVLWAREKNITSGIGGGLFGVGQSCTRAQVVTFLWAAAGKPEPTSTTNPFTDVSEGDFFYKAVLWAVENGITKGITPDTFAPNNTCTRAQVVTFLYAATEKNN